MIIKICGITTLDDALAAADGGASALGFNFYPKSSRYITPEAAARIAERLHGPVWRVGVFVNEPRDHMFEIGRIAGLDVLQLHGDETALPEGVRVWKALRVDDKFSMSALDAYNAEAYLLDAVGNGSYGGSGTTFDWTLARPARHKVILAGGLDASNVRQAIEIAQPWGVDACSRLESSPGKKDHLKLLQFLKAVSA